VVDLPAGAVLTDLLRIVSERSLSMAVVVDEGSGQVRGVVTAERLNTVIGAELRRRNHRS
jgi:CBS domain containing-hemolysin-like protein